MKYTCVDWQLIILMSNEYSEIKIGIILFLRILIFNLSTSSVLAANRMLYHIRPRDSDWWTLATVTVRTRVGHMFTTSHKHNYLKMFSKNDSFNTISSSVCDKVNWQNNKELLHGRSVQVVGFICLGRVICLDSRRMPYLSLIEITWRFVLAYLGTDAARCTVCTYISTYILATLRYYMHE